MANPLHKAEDLFVKRLTKKLKHFSTTRRSPEIMSNARYTVCMLGDMRLIENDNSEIFVVYNITDIQCDVIAGPEVMMAIGATLAFYGEHWQHHHLIRRLLSFAK